MQSVSFLFVSLEVAKTPVSAIQQLCVPSEFLTLYLSVPRCPSLYNKDNHSTCLAGWLGDLVCTQHSEQCLTHSKCSVVIMIQVFASMMKTLTMVQAPTLVYKPKDLGQINKKNLQSRMLLFLVSGRAGILSASLFLAFSGRFCTQQVFRNGEQWVDEQMQTSVYRYPKIWLPDYYNIEIQSVLVTHGSDVL